MAKSKSDNEKLFERLKDEEFYPLGINKCKIKDYFNIRDFVINDSGEFFIKHVALLRVLKELYNIANKESLVIQPPDGKLLCATVSVTYTVQPKQNKDLIAKWSAVDLTAKWSAVADCHRENLLEHEVAYTTTMAETRASGRAIRQLLGLDFCTKEEIGEIVQDVEDDNEPVEPAQLTVLENVFQKKHGITIEQIRDILGKSEDDLPSLELLTKGEATKVTIKLHKEIKKAYKKEGK